MDNDHSTLTLIVLWLGAVASWFTLSHILGVLTCIATVLHIVNEIRKFRKGPP